MGGSDAVHQPGVYGSEGDASPANIPGSRSDMTQWVDGDGNLWIFGGYGYDAGLYGIEYLNDLWRFNPQTNEWTWVSGSSVLDSEKVCADLSICGLPPVYGAKGAAAPENIPSGRAGAVGWIDKQGHFWLFGGYGLNRVGNKPGYVFCGLNELWEYDPSRFRKQRELDAAAAGLVVSNPIEDDSRLRVRSAVAIVPPSLKLHGTVAGMAGGEVSSPSCGRALHSSPISTNSSAE